MARTPLERKNSDMTDETDTISSVEILNETGPRSVSAGSMIVVSRISGFRRGGIEHPPLKIWSEGELTDAQITAISGSPELEIIRVS